MKLVKPDGLPNFGGTAPLGLVDVQLVADSLAEDHAFTKEYGILKDENGLYKHVSLVDVLTETQLSQVRDFILRLLETLSDGGAIVCFYTRALPDWIDGNEFENSVSIRGMAEDWGTNGEAHIFEVKEDELRFYVDLFGHFDAMRGVLVEKGVQTKRLLERISVSNPIPTTSRALLSQEGGDLTILRTLEVGTVFFEETCNGTRLRLASNKLNSSALEGIVETCLQAVD